MYRYFLKDSIRKKIAFKYTDQNQGVPTPPIEKPYPDDSILINLPGPDDWPHIPKTDITLAIGNRKSHRVYLNQSLSLEELAYLLWCIQGIRGKEFNGHAYRNIPSAGCRHALETYLACEAIDAGACAIAAYDQEELDELIGLDGDEEFAVYLAPVGKVKKV